MHFGVSMFHTDYSIPAVQLARALEDRAFESMWAPEHSHIPVPRRTPFPGGGEVPKPYYEVMDPFVVLSAAAAVTKTLKLATGVCLVVQRDPIQTAKLVASIDQVSGGRFLFGVGGGWNAEEIEDHGTAFKTRFKLMRERIEAMKEIWTKDKAEYHGEFVDFPTMMTWPKPAQKPYPPIIVGGAFPTRLDVPSATAMVGCRLLVGRPTATSTSTYQSSSGWRRKPVARPMRCRSLCSAVRRMQICSSAIGTWG